MKKSCLALFLVVSIVQNSQAQPDSKEEISSLEPVIVTATRIEEPLAEVSSAVTVIPSEEIKERGITLLHEAIQNVPGIHTTVQGTKGSFPSLFTRGAESDHTLIMIDGVPINRDGGAFFDHVTLENVDRIEIVRGPGSAVYGSSALAGTVNLITKRGAGAPSASVSVAGGTYRTLNERFGFSAGDEKLHFRFTFFRYDQFGGRFENSDYHNMSLSGTFGLNVSRSTEIRTTVDWQKHDVGVFSNTPGPRFGPTDPDARAERDNLTLGTELIHHFTEIWEARLRLSRFDADRLNRDESDPGDPSTFTGASQFERDLVELQNNFQLAQGRHYRDTLIVGGEFQKENLVEFDNFAPGALSIDQSRKNRALYLADELALFRRLFLNIGARWDDNEAFGADLNWKGAASYLHRPWGAKLRASAGTGIKAPTLFENFDSQFGNRDLRPEESFSWEIGVDQGWTDDRVHIGLTYFDMKMEDLVQFKTLTLDPFTATFVNAGEAESRGVEVEAAISPFELLRIRSSYTLLDTEVTASNDPDNPSFQVGSPLLRRPRHSGRVQVGLGQKERWEVLTDLIYVGKRDDFSFAPGRPPREVNPDYTRVDLAGHYRPAGGARFFARIENLFNREYDEVLGFPSPGLNIFAGLEYRAF